MRKWEKWVLAPVCIGWHLVLMPEWLALWPSGKSLTYFNSYWFLFGKSNIQLTAFTEAKLCVFILTLTNKLLFSHRKPRGRIQSFTDHLETAFFSFFFPLWPLETCFPACLLHCLKITWIRKCFLMKTTSQLNACSESQTCEYLGPNSEIKCVFNL